MTFAAGKLVSMSIGNANFGVNYPIPGGYINVTNGNVHITIPLGTFKQRGNLPPIKINLEYDSRIWQIVDNGSYSWQPNNVPNSMGGWRLTTGLEQGTTSYVMIADYGGPYVCNGHVIQNALDGYTYTKFNWTDGNGTNHIFDASAKQGVPPPCNGIGNYPPGSGDGWAVDGSGYYVKVVNNTEMTIYDNSGNQVYPVRADPNGNTVTINANGTVIDSMGRTLITTTTGANGMTYNLLKEGGGTNSFGVYTESISVNTAFNQSDVSENSTPLTTVQSIYLPDGSSYNFTYDVGSYGEMESMTLPTGGVVYFSYINYQDSYNNFNRWISQETEGYNPTNFTPAVLPPDSHGNLREQMTLSRPSGDSRVYMLTLNNGAWDGETDTYQGALKLLSVVNNYNFTSYQCSSSIICNGAEYIAASSSTATMDDISPTLTSVTCYTYAAPWIGKTSTIQEWDYSATPPSCPSQSTPNRETDYTYNYFLNGASLVTQVSENFNGQAFAQTVYGHDGLGNVTSKMGGLSGNQVTTKYGFDGNGMRTSKTDPNGNLISYTYGCNDGFLSQATYPQTGSVSHFTKVNPDCSSGDPLTTTDQNGRVTTYGYDGLGRKSSVSYPDGGSTSYQYPASPPAQGAYPHCRRSPTA